MEIISCRGNETNMYTVLMMESGVMVVTTIESTGVSCGKCHQHFPYSLKGWKRSNCLTLQ